MRGSVRGFFSSWTLARFAWLLSIIHHLHLWHIFGVQCNTLLPRAELIEAIEIHFAHGRGGVTGCWIIDNNSWLAQSCPELCDEANHRIQAVQRVGKTAVSLLEDWSQVASARCGVAAAAASPARSRTLGKRRRQQHGSSSSSLDVDAIMIATKLTELNMSAKSSLTALERVSFAAELIYLSEHVRIEDVDRDGAKDVDVDKEYGNVAESVRFRGFKFVCGEFCFCVRSHRSVVNLHS